MRYTNPLTGVSVKYTVRYRHYEERRELRADLPRDLRKIRVRLAQVRLSYLLAYTIKSFSHLPAYYIPPVIFCTKHTACACRLPNARYCKTRARRGSRCWSSIYGGRSAVLFHGVVPVSPCAGGSQPSPSCSTHVRCAGEAPGQRATSRQGSVLRRGRTTILVVLRLIPSHSKMAASHKFGLATKRSRRHPRDCTAPLACAYFPTQRFRVL